MKTECRISDNRRVVSSLDNLCLGSLRLKKGRKWHILVGHAKAEFFPKAVCGYFILTRAWIDTPIQKVNKEDICKNCLRRARNK